MLTALRNSAQSWVIKLLLGLIVVTFVISFGIGTFSNPKEVLVEVGGEEIMVPEYLRRYQEEMDRLRRQFGENAESLAQQLNLREQVMNGLVNRRLMLQAAERQGLQVTEEELREAVTSQDSFHVNQRFDFDTYQAVLRQNGMTPADYEARLRRDLLLQKLQRHLLAGVIVNDHEVEQRYRVENERVAVDYVVVDPAAFDLSAPPGVEEQQAYYEAHQDEFRQPVQVKVRYFTLSLGHLEQTAEVSDRAVERYYERYKDDEFTTPGQVRARHILKRVPADASEEQVAEARAALEPVLEKARSGADFAALAREHSEDPSAEKGGDLGFFRRGEMVPAFADAAFSMEPGQISDIVRSPFGLHIIKVEAVRPGEVKPFEAVREEIVAELKSQRAERMLDIALERVPGEVRREGLEAVAAGYGQEPGTTPFFDDSTVLPDLGSASPLYEQTAERNPDTVGVWRRNPVQGHVFYQVEEKKDAYVRPFEAVQPRVAERTAAQQRRELALADAKEAYAGFEDDGDLRAYAKERGLSVKSTSFTATDNAVEGLGINHDFQRTAFRLSESDPFGLSIKDNQAHLLRFKRRYFEEPDKAGEIKADIRERMREALRQYVLQSEIDRLRKRVEVKVVSPEYLMAGSAPTSRRRRAF